MKESVLLLHKHNASPDSHLVQLLRSGLTSEGFEVFTDERQKIGMGWAIEVERRISAADAVVVVVSPVSCSSEMLEYIIEATLETQGTSGKPKLLIARADLKEALTGTVGAYAQSYGCAVWSSPADDESVLSEILTAVRAAKGMRKVVELAGGAMAPTSQFYTVRESDREFEGALDRHESIVLVKGARQVGKTSLIGRGIARAEAAGCRVVTTDFQSLGLSYVNDSGQFARMLAGLIARQTKFAYDFQSEWDDMLGPIANLDQFVRALVESEPTPLVWFMDEADRLFTSPHASDFFAVVRSWHNARARDPKGPWHRFTSVIAYATEARLFIQDLNQSPFNVGRQLRLRNFTLEETTDLNRRFGSPIERDSHLAGLYHILAGHPYLTAKAFELLANQVHTYHELMEIAASNDGPFADHLGRMLLAVSQAPDILACVKASLSMAPHRDSNASRRLVTAGILIEGEHGDLDFACDLYTQYLSTHL